LIWQKFNKAATSDELHLFSFFCFIIARHFYRNTQMESQKVDMFIMANGKFFESHQLPGIRERLLAMDDSKWAMVQTMQFKDPTTSLIVSILAGSLGIDRFIIGDTGMGVGKLLTCGGLGIWTIVDWFMIQGATREKNFAILQSILY
jgi:TM2 domain-containing membrane protein YozV